MTKPQLDSDRVGPGTGEYDRIEQASDVIGDKIREAAERRGFKLWWSWGDSKGWRVIIGIPTERELTEFVAIKEHVDFAGNLTDLVGSVVVLNDGFKLYLDMDSDERVEANEGWFFRVRTADEVGQQFVFEWKGERLSLAPN